jgi:hypothetical protein
MPSDGDQGASRISGTPTLAKACFALAAVPTSGASRRPVRADSATARYWRVDALSGQSPSWRMGGLIPVRGSVPHSFARASEGDVFV